MAEVRPGEERGVEGFLDQSHRFQVVLDAIAQPAATEVGALLERGEGGGVLAQVFAFLGQGEAQRYPLGGGFRQSGQALFHSGHVVARLRLPAQGRAHVPGVGIFRGHADHPVEQILRILQAAQRDQRSGMVVQARGIRRPQRHRLRVTALGLRMQAEHGEAQPQLLQQHRFLRRVGGQRVQRLAASRDIALRMQLVYPPQCLGGGGWQQGVLAQGDAHFRSDSWR